MSKKVIIGRSQHSGRIIIRTQFNNQPRGSFYPAKLIFRRDNTPLWQEQICLEPDVVHELTRLLCEQMEFHLRDKRTVKVSLDDFMSNSRVVEIGQGEDRREQFCYRIGEIQSENLPAKREALKGPQPNNLFA